jgi:hypothetical protein
MAQQQSMIKTIPKAKAIPLETGELGVTGRSQKSVVVLF